MALKAYEAAAFMKEIGETITQVDKQMANALQAIAVAESTLNGMPATYGPFITSLDAAVGANPGNVTWEELKARKDLFVSEFNVLKTYAADLGAAATGVVKP